MRVLLLAENWPPRVGGIENYLTNIAAYLPKGSVTVVAPRVRIADYPAEGRDPVGSGGQLPITSVSVERHRFFWPLIKPSWLPLFISLYRRAKREPHNVTLCGKALFEGLVGYYLKKYLGIPYIVFTYAMEIETWATTRRTRRTLIRVLHYADQVVYINEYTRKKLVELGVSKHTLVKIWPGVQDSYFNKPNRTTIDATLAHYSIKPPYIFTVGRLVHRKGFDLLIRAFAKLEQTKFADVSLIVAGEGPERSHLEKLAQQEFVNTSVKFLGFVPDQHLPALYAGAELFALTPHAGDKDLEGFGIVYLEAAAQGIAAVATTGSGATEAVIHQHTGIVVNPATTAINKALEHLLSHRVERQQYGKNAAQRAHHDFRWSKRILLVKAVIDAVMATKSVSTQRSSQE